MIVVQLSTLRISAVNEYQNVIIAGGHAMLGISQGTGTGLLVSQLVQKRNTEISISAFKVERF